MKSLPRPPRYGKQLPFGPVLGKIYVLLESRCKLPPDSLQDQSTTSMDLESQEAQNDRPLYRQVAHNSLKVARYYGLLAFHGARTSPKPTPGNASWLCRPTAPGLVTNSIKPNRTEVSNEGPSTHYFRTLVPNTRKFPGTPSSRKNRPLYAKVAHHIHKVAPNDRLLAFQVPNIEGLWSQIPVSLWFWGRESLNIGDSGAEIR